MAPSAAIAASRPAGVTQVHFSQDKAVTTKPIILAVDSNLTNLKLIAQYLEREGYQTRTASSLVELDKSRQEKEKVSLALIDLSGFDRGIWDRCEQLRKAKIPFLVISPQRSLIIQRDSMKHGASGVLVKPLGIKELAEYIHALVGS